MDNSDGCRIFLCFLLVTVKDTSGQIKPSNAVAEIAGEAIFNCSDTSLLPNWITSKDGTNTNQLLIAPGCNVNAALLNHYRTEQTGASAFICNLIVFNVTMEQAGVYWCTGTGVPSYALLTVLDSSPTITYNNTPDVIEGENVVITCTLNYSGSVEPAPTLRPYFYWTDYTGNNVSSFYDSMPVNSPVISQLSVTAGRQDIMPYTCRVYLKLIPAVTPMYASNTPTVNSNASSSTITVHYGPSKPSSTNKPEVITNNGVPCGVSVLTCSSTANPAPSYRWYDSTENVILSTTSTLTLAEVNRTYKCEAYNTIRNVLYNASTTYIVSKDNCSTSTVDCCVYPRNETTSVTGEGCDNGTLCDCSQGSSGIILTCNAKTFPNASYMWTGSDGQVTDGQVFNRVTANGTHRCTAYFDRASSNYTGDVIFTNGTNETTVDTCCTWELVVSVVIPFIAGNVIFLVVFDVVYYKRSGFKRIMDNRFPECAMMKPILFTIVSILIGLFVIPIVVTIAYCSSLKQDCKFSVGAGANNKKGSDKMPAEPKKNQENEEGKAKGPENSPAAKDDENLANADPVGAVANNKKGSDKMPDEPNKKDRQQRNEEGKPKVDSPKKAQVGENFANADPGISISMIAVMWCVDIILLFPTAFVVVYFVPCNQMRFEIS